ncbi:DUF4145 domain-containing protein [Aeromonas hydrophila]|uniref:DUF4145 domain-containing protein n=1 Tax=Aeromonas hydrophila TaxID=644 RepID=UPI0009BE59A1|nr:DUF4145 domain-containing protein [Aeromonas hydrophila]HAU4927506.1 DUF4145 domain-containing protein [Aeromonas hydrophila]
MDRSLYKYNFTRTNTPDWICPTCKKGILRIVDDSFKTVETRDSREAQEHPGWDPSCVSSIYSCLLRCNNKQCQEIVASTGGGGADIEGFYNSHGHPEQRWVEDFRPTFFEPPLAILDIPASCPTEVAKPLQESFRLFFCSPASAANNARASIESILTQLDVPTHDTKSKRLPLGARLKLLPAEHSEFNTLFNAIRLFGNDGSHPDSKITTDDVMDAYELIEHVLQVLYNPALKLPTDIVEKMVKKFDT